MEDVRSAVDYILKGKCYLVTWNEDFALATNSKNLSSTDVCRTFYKLQLDKGLRTFQLSMFVAHNSIYDKMFNFA